MNILPHKSWNPYSFKNKEKVRLDEEKHQKEQEEVRKQQLKEDADARLDTLRKRAGVKTKKGPNHKSHNDEFKQLVKDVAAGVKKESEGAGQQEAAVTAPQHINLFETEERESKKRLAKAPPPNPEPAKKERPKPTEDELKRRDDRWKAKLDPLVEVNKRLAASARPAFAAHALRHNERNERALKRRHQSLYMPGMQAAADTSRSVTPAPAGSSSGGGGRTIEQLREERLRREEAERRKRQRLMQAAGAGPHGGGMVPPAFGARPSGFGFGFRP